MDQRREPNIRDFAPIVPKLGPEQYAPPHARASHTVPVEEHLSHEDSCRLHMLAIAMEIDPLIYIAENVGHLSYRKMMEMAELLCKFGAANTPEEMAAILNRFAMEITARKDRSEDDLEDLQSRQI